MSYPGYSQAYRQPPPHQGYGQYPPAPPQPHAQYPLPSQYPPPQGGYHHQPPPGGYHQQHPPGQYPPQHYPYGQLPPPGPYGAPPHQQYGPHPSVPPPGQYGIPLPSSHLGGPVQPTPPSLGYGAPQIIQWDASGDAQALRSAMKGIGTDEGALIGILANKDPLQIDLLRKTFDATFRRDLIKDIKSETSGWFGKALVQLACGPLLVDVHGMYNSMAVPGTKEVVLNDILLSRSNADIRAIKSAYQKTFHKSLEDTVKGDLSMKTERQFLMVLSANRAEDAAPVVPHQVDDDVMQIYKATEGRMGTDELLVCSILSYRNDNQIRAIAHSYNQKFNRDLEKVIKALRHAVDKYMHAATLLEESMAGLGTKDHLLVSRVIRFHWDRNVLANVKGAYQQKYARMLESRIKGETSRDYGRLMLACVGE